MAHFQGCSRSSNTNLVAALDASRNFSAAFRYHYTQDQSSASYLNSFAVPSKLLIRNLISLLYDSIVLGPLAKACRLFGADCKAANIIQTEGFVNILGQQVGGIQTRRQFECLSYRASPHVTDRIYNSLASRSTARQTVPDSKRKSGHRRRLER